jgi:hypothetical protein
MTTKTDTPLATVSAPSETINILKTATAKKLNPNLDGDLEYQVALVDGALHLRLSANSSGGFFSKEWISLEKLEQCFDSTLSAETDFRSTLLKSVFEQGKSSNNAGFLCACLRAEQLLSPSSKNIFMHRFTGNFEQWRKALNKLTKK